MKLFLLLAGMICGAEAAESPTVLIVVGAAGSQEYRQRFDAWADRWVAAAKDAGVRHRRIGDDDGSEDADRERLAEVLSAEARPTTAPLWLVLIGHGTFDGQTAKFNLRGPDVSATELGGWLEPLDRPLAVVNCASSSAPFINRLSAPKRVIITATKSGYELNYARFGDHLSAAIVDPRADLDKDGQTSLLEAFLLASARVAEFYQQESRLQTETALIDDDGDGRGTPATWFRGIHVTRQAKDGDAAPDGSRAHQLHLVPSPIERDMPAPLRTQRDEIELEIARLRKAKGTTLGEEQYYASLEPLLVELAKLYQSLEQPKDADAESPESD